MGRSALIAMLLLTACTPGAKPAPKETNVAKPKPVVAAADDDEAPEPVIVIKPKPGHIAVQSSVRGYSLIPTDALPRIERARASVAMCDDWGEIDPQTPGGKAAKALGWRVTEEQPIGRLTAVTILRRYQRWAGIPCVPLTSKIAFFDAGTIVAVLDPEPNPILSPAALARMADGALRIWTTMPSPPIGDLTFDGKTLRLSATAPVDTVCDGRVKIPNLFRKPIQQAREIVMKAGWKPYRPDGPIDRETDASEYYRYYRKGITEIDHCAVDSVGQCLFYYRSRLGVLRVETGQLNDADREGVLNYELQCRDRSGKLGPAPWKMRGGSYY